MRTCPARPRSTRPAGRTSPGTASPARRTSPHRRPPSACVLVAQALLDLTHQRRTGHRRRLRGGGHRLPDGLDHPPIHPALGRPVARGQPAGRPARPTRPARNGGASAGPCLSDTRSPARANSSTLACLPGPQRHPQRVVLRPRGRSRPGVRGQAGHQLHQVPFPPGRPLGRRRWQILQHRDRAPSVTPGPGSDNTAKSTAASRWVSSTTDAPPLVPAGRSPAGARRTMAPSRPTTSCSAPVEPDPIPDPHHLPTNWTTTHPHHLPSRCTAADPPAASTTRHRRRSAITPPARDRRRADARTTASGRARAAPAPGHPACRAPSPNGIPAPNTSRAASISTIRP